LHFKGGLFYRLRGHGVANHSYEPKKVDGGHDAGSESLHGFRTLSYGAIEYAGDG
jgi:hypothetical protein